MRGARYRVWQFWRLVARRISPEELASVQAWLSPPLFALFCRMTPAEQYHAYCVRQTLVAHGQSDADLLTAALLHDVGKSHMPLAVWEKVMVVLGKRFAPGVARAWGQGHPGRAWWRRPFVNALQHPAWGADLVADHGGSPRLADLVRRHQAAIPADDPLAPLFSALQSADNSN